MRDIELGLRVSVDVDKRQTAVLRAGGGLFLAAPFARAYRMGQADRPGYVHEAAARARARPAPGIDSRWVRIVSMSCRAGN